MAAENGNVAVYTDYHELLRRGDIDAVSVCVPSGMHGAVAMDAARAGKHVMLQKPCEITLPKIDELIKVCDESGVKLGAIFQRRTSRLWHRIKHVVDSGQLGKMVLGDAYMEH